MKTVKEYLGKYLKIFLGTGILLTFLFGFSIYNIFALNYQENIISSKNPDDKIKVVMSTNNNQNDKWSTSMQLSDSERDVHFYGETCNCSINNRSDFDIKDWTLKINITQDCYLNGFWCGDFEIHQFRNGKETVQRINDYTTPLSDLLLECNKYSSNMMIHLIPGDYLVYYPSAEAKEEIVKAHDSIGIGFIFYYRNQFDLNDFELTYHNNVKLYETIYFKILIFIFFVWFIGLVFFHFFLMIDKKFSGEKDTAIRNISVMAELYLEVHMINLETGTGYLVKGDQNNLMFNFLGKKVKYCFDKYIETDCKEQYVNDLSKFLDLKSIKELLKSVSSISYEYESKTKGWISLKFFKMVKKDDIYQLIFTVKDINKEKLESEQEQERIKQNDFKQYLHNTFIDTLNSSTAQILNEIIERNKELLSIVQKNEEKELAVKIDYSIEHYKLLQNCVYDMYALETNNFIVQNQQYDFVQSIERVAEILTPYYKDKPFEFQKNFDKGIPELLEGDKTRIMQIVMLILYSAFANTKQGDVKFSVFAKRHENEEELLISIKDTGTGFTEQEMKEVYSFLSGSRINSFENPALVYLKIIDGILKNMNSKLNLVSVYGMGTEFYFSIKQKIVEKV